MRKAKIIVSLSLATVIALTGISALANKTEFKERGNKPSFEMARKAKPEMSEDKKAEMQEKRKEQLEKQLADGKITKEQYDEILAKIESGEFGKPGFIGKGPKGEKREMPEMSEDKKAEMQEKRKEQLEKQLADGKITKEQYDEILAKIESGEFGKPGFMGRGPKGEKREMPELTEEQKAELKEKIKSGEFKGHGPMGKGPKGEHRGMMKPMRRFSEKPVETIE